MFIDIVIMRWVLPFQSRYERRALMFPFAARRLKIAFKDRQLRSSATRQLAFFPRTGVAYNRIKKNGNTSVMLLLSLLENGEIGERDETKSRAQTLGDLPLRTLGRLDGFRYLVTIRNPYARVLSAFLEKFRGEDYRRRYGDFELTPAGFGQFLSWLADGGISQNGHWDLQSKAMIWPLAQYDAVVRLESFSADFRHFLDLSGLDVDQSLLNGVLPQDRNKETRAQARLEEFYDADRRRRVSQLYANDFSGLGYET